MWTTLININAIVITCSMYICTDMFLCTLHMQVILNALGFDWSLEDSISLRRLHHQLFPNNIFVEKNFPHNIQESLKNKGHKITVSSSYAVVQGILVHGKKIYATSDARKGGSPSGY